MRDACRFCCIGRAFVRRVVIGSFVFFFVLHSSFDRFKKRARGIIKMGNVDCFGCFNPHRRMAHTVTWFVHPPDFASKFVSNHDPSLVSCGVRQWNLRRSRSPKETTYQPFLFFFHELRLILCRSPCFRNLSHTVVHFRISTSCPYLRLSNRPPPFLNRLPCAPSSCVGRPLAHASFFLRPIYSNLIPFLWPPFHRQHFFPRFSFHFASKI